MESPIRPCAVALVALWWPLVAACSGSAAESPWPVEPVDTEPGPAGEAAPGEDVIDVDDLAKEDRYGDAGAGKTDKSEPAKTDSED
ncbi:MAG: hypothetical protein JRI68_01670 [Deltaproteobacteria bacterium]|nr:hypothetical protein [Deltaproteobacteria bacterium]